MTDGVSAGVGVNVEDGGGEVVVDGGVVGVIVSVVTPLMEFVLRAWLSTVPGEAKASNVTKVTAVQVRRNKPIVLEDGAVMEILIPKSTLMLHLALHHPRGHKQWGLALWVQASARLE